CTPALSPLSSSSPLRRPPTSPLFPYTTLFRSPPSTSASTSPAAGGVRWQSPPPGSGRRGSSRRHRPRASASWSGRCRAHRSAWRSEEHTSELQSRFDLVCRLLLEKKKSHLHAG